MLPDALPSFRRLSRYVHYVEGSEWGAHGITGSGRGFFIRPHVFVTCRHVMTKSPFGITLANKGGYLSHMKKEGELRGNVHVPQDAALDIAFIVFDGVATEILPASCINLRAGETVHMVGANASKSILAGKVRGKAHEITLLGGKGKPNRPAKPVWEIHGFSGRKGRSGSPVFNRFGEVVGMFIAKDRENSYMHSFQTIRQAMRVTLGPAH